MDNIPNDIITATIPEFCRVSGNGRSKTYELLAEGRLKSIKIGKRRLILINSYRELVDELLAEAEAGNRAAR
jgi:excisionase family DNA binding protein